VSNQSPVVFVTTASVLQARSDDDDDDDDDDVAGMMIVIITPATRSDIPSCNRRPSFISGCCIYPLELVTAGCSCSVLGFSVCLSSTTKDIPVSQIIS